MLLSLHAGFAKKGEETDRRLFKNAPLINFIQRLTFSSPA